ncbi:putative transposase remnant [Yersinia rohdei]|uniref:Putative transposase remnant n=1 Tax=Yersinia rohdei TaxID=29485 RepID=A0A0U1HX48_YERRO|nr:putative transposase remnant [Yersinia rohdei]
MSLIRNAFSRLHYPIDVIAQCVHWYLAYALSLRHLEEMMAERGIVVDHSMLHRWVIRLVPLLDKVFRRAQTILAGIECVQMIRKGPLQHADGGGVISGGTILSDRCLKNRQRHFC